jgi:hypothetical protein
MRGVRRVVAALVAAGLATVGLLVALEAALLALDRPSALVDRGAWADELRATQWDDRNAVAAAVALVALGLALLVVALAPGRPRWRAALDGSAWVSRATVERRAQRAAEAVAGPGEARARLGRRSLEVRARAPRDREAEVRRAVEDAVAELRLTDPVPVRLRMAMP